MPQLNNREYRQLQSFVLQQDQKRIDSNYYVEGYATTWDRYVLYDFGDGDILYEQFSKDCFKNTDMSDIIMQYDHSGKVYARKSNDTLIVEPKDEGLFICADLSKSQSAKDLYEEISNGLITKMSWGFVTGDYDYDEKTNTIIHKSVKKIYDVSAVSIPANDGTSINCRSELLEKDIKNIRENLIKTKMNEQLRSKLELRLKLEGVL